MQIHELQLTHKPKKRKRIGRGGKRGRYCGRGIKGQKARAGRRLQPLIRQIIKKYPKLRGYRRGPRKKIETSINLLILEKNFKNEEKITPKILLERKIIKRIKGKIPKVKILGKGNLTKKLIIKECQVSKGTKEKIEKVGGKVE